MIRGKSLAAALVLAVLSAGCAPIQSDHTESVARPFRPTFDPFSRDGVWDGGDTRMSVEGDVVDFAGECGRLQVRRISGPNLTFGPEFEEEARTKLFYRARIEAYERMGSSEQCDARVGDDVALVAMGMVLAPEFGAPPTIIASVNRLFEARLVLDPIVSVPFSHPPL